ncbi:MAG: ATPase [Sphingomonadales bacterium]|nr:ATPase [Sphingomonadales bacterium]PIX64106.1 MAG: ATPase [Sphingomonadales bacterium CG_4_10_14_3_um_filter_58_15]NCO49081.1 ATPase [Sphingomonadales bacterium]NCO99436.1 ATPase [Sphingomonadales bacterium]NCP27088.1 ATPase [Sphingomonadales bacterium]
MKRFYKDVSVSPVGDAFAILLDGRPMKTPQRNALAVPVSALADAIAAEWAAQGDNIIPASMPLTALAQGALDQVDNERDRIVGRIAAFADSDMLYYRADEGQQALIDHQAKHWDPLLDWARQHYDVGFNLVYGIRYEAQPQETIERLAATVEAQDDFTVAAMLSLVGLSGSLIATLGLVEQTHDTETLWPLVNLEELWQEQQWGRDDQAFAAREIKRAEFEAAARFLDLARR